jgi:hypothetical protein
VVVDAADAETAGPASKIAVAERAMTGQSLALSRIRPVRVLARNVLSSWSHGARVWKPSGPAGAQGASRSPGTMGIRWRATVQNGPKAVRVGQCHRMERMLRCLHLGTIASEELCSEGGHSSGRLPEAP